MRIVTAALPVVLVLTACGSGASTPVPSAPDIAVLTCGQPGGSADPMASPRATGTFINRDDQPGAWAFSVAFLDDTGVRQTDGYVSIAEVQPGETVQWETLGGGNAAPASCEVFDVQPLDLV